MASGMTRTQVCNLALDLIRSTPLIDVNTSDSPEARFLNRNFDHAARVIMRSYPWGFAKEFHELPADADAPPFKWTASYTMPAGVARVIPPTAYGERYGQPVPYEVVGNKLYTNHGAPFRVIFVMDRSSNPGAWDDLMTEVVRCTLGLGLANKFPSKIKFVELASQLLAQATSKAEEIDAYEGTPEPTENFDIIRLRGSVDGLITSWR